MPKTTPNTQANPVKSVFSTMRPNVTALAPKPLASPVPTAAGAGASKEPARSPAGDRRTELPVAPYDVSVIMQLVAELPNNEPIRVRSVLGTKGERNIHLSLNTNHLIVSRSLKRADTLLIRFLLCIALAEYLQFWGRRHDGQSLRAAITKAAGIEPEQYWGLTLATKLSASELLRSLDATPIFGPGPSEAVHTLFVLSAVRLRETSDMPNWRPRPLREEGARHA